jgi:hypothetical protein
LFGARALLFAGVQSLLAKAAVSKDERSYYQRVKARTSASAKSSLVSTTSGSGWAQFVFESSQWQRRHASERVLASSLNGWQCFAYERSYLFGGVVEKGNVWCAFPGLHGANAVNGERGDNYLQIPLKALTRLSADELLPPEKIKNVERGRAHARELNKRLYPQTHSQGLSVCLGGLSGFAGLIVPAVEGILYTWDVDGTALGNRCLRGHYVPLPNPALAFLTRAGDNIYTNAGELDTALFDQLLAQVLWGWVVDPEFVDAAVEAAVWLRCERDVFPDEDEGGGELVDTRAQWLPLPLTCVQSSLVGANAVLVWPNSD